MNILFYFYHKKNNRNKRGICFFNEKNKEKNNKGRFYCVIISLHFNE